MDLITLLMYAILFYIVWIAVKTHRLLKIEKHNKVVDYLNNIIHQVNVENYHGINYWFDEHTNKFLAQGASLEEITNVLKIRFPNHIFLLKDQGGMCAKTDWQLVPFETLKSINFLTEERI